MRRQHLWRMSRNTAERFLNLMELLEYYDEDSDDYAAIRDEIRALPGHPPGTEEDDYIRWTITTVQH